MGRSVVVVNSDSFRRDNLSVYGKSEAITPNLDALAQCSAVFTEAYAGSYPTIPNRTDAFLGTWTFPNRGWEALDRKAPALAGMLSQAGVETLLHLDCPHMLKAGSNFERGFTSWKWVRGQEGDPLAPQSLTRRMIPPGELAKNRQPITLVTQHMANQLYRRRVHEEDYSMAVVARNAIRDLSLLPKGRPFFLWVDMFDPHEPYDFTRECFDLFFPEYQGPIYSSPVYGHSDIYARDELRAIRSAYLAAVTMVDRWIGRILQALRDLGHDENTVVIFTSDHGVLQGEHGWTGKIWPPLYSEIARLPLLISTPELRAAKKRIERAEIVQPVDLAPTILDLMDIAAPPDWRSDGVSLAPFLRGDSTPTREAAFTGQYRPFKDDGVTPLRVSTREWTLVYPHDFADKTRQPPLLFHLSEDPGETRDALRGNLGMADDLFGKYLEFYREFHRADEPAPVTPPRSLL